MRSQVTYNGKPLYFFSKDTAPGDTNGIYPNWEAVVLAAAATPAPTVVTATPPPTSTVSPSAPGRTERPAVWILIALAAGSVGPPGGDPARRQPALSQADRDDCWRRQHGARRRTRAVTAMPTPHAQARPHPEAPVPT